MRRLLKKDAKLLLSGYNGMNEMNEMIERVARALRLESAQRRMPGITLADLPRVDELATGIGEMYRMQARTAIAALREPTEAMCDAGGYSHFNRQAANIWRAMIDAALKEV